MNNIDIINEAFENGITDDNRNDVSNAVTETISSLDEGKLRVAENKDGQWTVNEWSKKAILLSFRLNKNIIVNNGIIIADKNNTLFATFLILSSLIQSSNTSLILSAEKKYAKTINKLNKNLLVEFAKNFRTSK